MGLNDLLGNRQSKTRIVAKLFFRALRIKAVKYFGQGLFRNTGACIFDHHQHAVFTRSRPDTDGIAIFAKTDRIGNQIDKYLRQARL